MNRAIAILMMVLATVAAQAQTPHLFGAAPIHCQGFGIVETPTPPALPQGLSFGRYLSGLPACVALEELPWASCSTNGYIHLNNPHGENGSVTQVCHFYGPAVDFLGVPIPGTEDDVVRVTTDIVIGAIAGTMDFAYYVKQIQITGTSIEWESGADINGTTLAIEGFDTTTGRGKVWLWEELMGDFEGEQYQYVIDPTFNVTVYGAVEQFVRRDIVPIPVPEPTFAVGALAAFVGLLGIHALSRGE